MFIVLFAGLSFAATMIVFAISVLAKKKIEKI
jgi:hypothetical protein